MAHRIRDPQSRERLVLAAWRLVAAQGVHATSVRGIAKEAGVSTGSVTHYFEDKAEVMTAVLRYNNSMAAQRIAAACAGTRGLAQLQHTARALLPLDEDQLRTWTVWVAFWGNRLAHQLTAREGQESGFGALLAWLRQACDDAVATGELAADTDTDHEAERLLVLIGGLGLMSGGEPQLIDQVRHRAEQLLGEHLAALTGKPPAKVSARR